MRRGRSVTQILGWAMLRMRRGHRRATPLAIGAFFSTLVVAGLGGLYANVEAMIVDGIVTGGTLSVIEVRSDIDDARPLTATALEIIADQPDVASVEPALDGASIYGADGGWVLPVVAYQASQAPPDVVRAPAPGEVLAPASAQGTEFTPFIGHDLEVEFTTRTGADEGISERTRLTLIGTYEPAWQVLGAGVALVHFDTALELVAAREGMTPPTYLSERGVPSALIVAADQSQVADLSRQLRSLGFAASPLADRLGKLPDVFALLPYGVAAAGVVGLVLLVASTAAGVGAAVRNQLNDLALLRVNGWSVGQIRSLVTAESVLSSAIGVVAAALTVTVVAPLLSMLVADHLGVTASGVVGRPIVVVAATAGATLLVAFVAARLGVWRSLRADPYIAVRQHGG